MVKNFFILTFKSIRHRKLRSWLTIIGVVIGIMLVVIILALGSGIQNAVARTLQMFGSDLITIFPGEETNPLAGIIGGQKFREQDLMDLERIEGVDFVVPMEIAAMNVEYRGEKESVLIHAASWEGMRKAFEQSQGLRLAEGNWPQSDQTKEVVLGYFTFNKLFSRPVQIGNEITIKSKRMKVVGYVIEIGNQMDDNTIYVSLAIFRQLTGTKAGAGSAFLKVTPGSDISFVAKQVRHQLSKQEVVRDFSVLTPDKAERLIGSVLSIIELVLVMIALISLLVGAVGIMNTMYTSVVERTRQIGVMKAVGASRDAILSLFLIESGMIGLIGGILGIVLGISMAFLIGLGVANLGISGLFSFASLDFFGLAVVLILTFIIGVLSGVLPARQAANMEPAEALRYE